MSFAPFYYLMALLLVVCIVAIPVTNMFVPAINAALGARTQKIVADPDAQIFFWSNYENEYKPF